MISTGAMALLVVLIPVFGYIADRLGSRALLKYISVGLSVLSAALYMALVQFPSIGMFAIVQIIFAVLISAAYGALPSTIVGIFPTHVRYTATGLAFNISVAAFGGTAPLVVTYLIQQTDALWIPGVILTGVGVISYVCISRLRNDYL
jgi:MHS family proline/betaine transporter-like MFS transporter